MDLLTGRNKLVIHKYILFLLGEHLKTAAGGQSDSPGPTGSRIAKLPEPALVDSRACSSVHSSGRAVVSGRPGWLWARVLVRGGWTDAQRHRTPGTPGELLAAGPSTALRSSQRAAEGRCD